MSVFKNMEGYSDPTAGEALKNIEDKQRAKDLVSVLIYIIRNSGFELTERIKLRDKKTGREFR